MRKTVRRSDSEWKELIEEFQNSGMTMHQWCVGEGVSATTFRRKFNLLSVGVTTAENDPVLSEIILEENAPAEDDAACAANDSNESSDAAGLCCEEVVEVLPAEEVTNADFVESDLLPELGRIFKSCKTVYFVDTENLSSEPIGSLLKRMDDSARVLLFYTKNSNHISYDVLGTFFERRDQISLVSCGCGTGNALDFQLVSVLGSLLSECMHSKVFDSGIPEFVIFSKDHGFDAVVRLWRSRGVRIRRSAPDEILRLEQKDAIADKAEDDRTLVKDAEPVLIDTNEEQTEVQEDEISQYYLTHPEYQNSMKSHLSCRMGAEFKRRGIKLQDKPSVMDVLLKIPAPKEADFAKVCAGDVAGLLAQIPADFIKLHREATYKQELKIHLKK